MHFLGWDVSLILIYMYLFILGTESPKQSRGHLAGLDSQLRVSIESFAAYIADHFSPTRKMPKVSWVNFISLSLPLHLLISKLTIGRGISLWDFILDEKRLLLGQADSDIKYLKIDCRFFIKREELTSA